MLDLFMSNIWWFVGGWYLIIYILATILAASVVYEDNMDIRDSLLTTYAIALVSPVIIPVIGVVIIFSPLLIPWFVTRKVVLDKKKKKQRIENVKQ